MHYTPIRISTIKPKKPITFDLFIYFKEQYLKYRERGLVLEDEHLGKLKKQQIARFYITEEDEPNYQAFLDEILDDALLSESVPIEEKINLTEGAVSTAIDQMAQDPLSPAHYKMTQKAAKNLRTLVSENPDALKNIFNARSASGEVIVRHCLSVAALVSRLGIMYNLSEEDLDNLGIAALLHDIGLSSDDELGELFLKKEDELSSDEKKKFKTHPMTAIQTLEKNEYVNKAILDLILSHEEKISGTGYPNKKSKLTIQEEILSLVNCFDKKVTVYGVEPKQAIKSLQVDELGNYSLELINKFKTMMKNDGLLD